MHIYSYMFRAERWLKIVHGVVIDSPWLRLYIVLEHSRSPSTQDDYSSYR